LCPGCAYLDEPNTPVDKISMSIKCAKHLTDEWYNEARKFRNNACCDKLHLGFDLYENAKYRERASEILTSYINMLEGVNAASIPPAVKSHLELIRDEHNEALKLRDVKKVRVAE